MFLIPGILRRLLVTFDTLRAAFADQTLNYNSFLGLSSIL